MLPVSFEFFPPKTPELEAALWQNLAQLGAYQPEFISVTYGAGGSTRERTHAIVKQLASDGKHRPAAHLTCVGASRTDIDAVIDAYIDAGVTHVVALRGDPAQGDTHYQPHPEGYAYAVDLVGALVKRGVADISVSAYPEKHPESTSFDEDLDVLKAKVDAGATRAISQYFFTQDIFERYMERITRAGITIPVIPGILPIHNLEQVVKFSARCGAAVPESILKRFEGLEDAPEKRKEEAVAIGAELAAQLIKAGAPALHFYTLNRAELTDAILQRLDFTISAR